MIRSTTFARPWALILLLLAALALTFLLAVDHGLAAPGGQNSPLATVASTVVSPLGTPSILPTPTPTATSPLPPTAEPPSTLLAWPTPTPTAYPVAVQAAIDALKEDEALGITDPEPSARLLVDDPSTGEELTAIRLNDPATGTSYWLATDSEGTSFLLPDWGDSALAMVAETENLAAADLQLFNGFYVPFPFTRQILWVGQVFYAKTATEYSIALDLAGEKVDQAEKSEAEAAAVSDYCGKVDVSLCLEILDADPGAASNAVLVMEDEADPEPVSAFLEASEVVFREDESEFYFRMENDTLRELAQWEGIDFIQKDYPDALLPLDTNLIIGLVEQSGALSLTLESQKLYPLLTYGVQASLERFEVTRTQSITLLAQIEGIFAPSTGPSSQSPAQARLALGNLSGRYNLALSYTDPEREIDLLDSYSLVISDGRAVIRAADTSFSWAKYPTWLRLPRNALWFVVQARATDQAGVAYDIALDEFTEKVEAFYADVAGLRARELQLAEGIYTNNLFIPPWKSWQIPDGEYVSVPVNESQSYLFRWPDIRYFTYSGTQSALEAVIAEHCVDEVAIVGYTAQGDVLDVCQP